MAVCMCVCVCEKTDFTCVKKLDSCKIKFNLFKDKINLNYFLKVHVVLAINTFGLSYTNQSFNAVWGNEHCLFSDSYRTAVRTDSCEIKVNLFKDKINLNYV